MLPWFARVKSVRSERRTPLPLAACMSCLSSAYVSWRASNGPCFRDENGLVRADRFVLIVFERLCGPLRHLVWLCDEATRTSDEPGPVLSSGRSPRTSSSGTGGAAAPSKPPTGATSSPAAALPSAVWRFLRLVASAAAAAAPPPPAADAAPNAPEGHKWGLVDLHEVTKNAARLARDGIPASSAVEIDIRAVPFVRGDSSRLFQALHILLTAACCGAERGPTAFVLAHDAVGAAVRVSLSGLGAATFASSDGAKALAAIAAAHGGALRVDAAAAIVALQLPAAAAAPSPPVGEVASPSLAPQPGDGGAPPPPHAPAAAGALSETAPPPAKRRGSPLMCSSAPLRGTRAPSPPHNRGKSPSTPGHLAVPPPAPSPPAAAHPRPASSPNASSQSHQHSSNPTVVTHHTVSDTVSEDAGSPRNCIYSGEAHGVPSALTAGVPASAATLLDALRGDGFDLQEVATGDAALDALASAALLPDIVIVWNALSVRCHNCDCVMCDTMTHLPAVTHMQTFCSVGRRFRCIAWRHASSKLEAASLCGCLLRLHCRIWRMSPPNGGMLTPRWAMQLSSSNASHMWLCQSDCLTLSRTPVS